METLSKKCSACKLPLPFSDFYQNKEQGYYLSECKECMKIRSRSAKKGNNLVPFVESEIIAVEYLKKHGIPTLPGKALHYSHVDLVAFGCVHIESKYAKLDFARGVEKFTFATTPAQRKHGFRAHVVLLICDYGDHCTFHFFPSDHKVFFINGHIKTGFTFTPGNYEAKKHGANRTVLVQGMMNETQDKVVLIYDVLQRIVNELKSA